MRPLVVDTEPPDALTLWVVYSDPTDYPGCIVVRRQFTTREGICIMDRPEIVAQGTTTESLRKARRAIPYGLYCFNRDRADDPKIVEVWI